MTRRIFLKLMGVASTIPIIGLPESSEAKAFTKSQLDNINTRNVILEIQSGVYRILENYMFELNSGDVQKAITLQTREFLSSFQANRSIRGYISVCDYSNNVRGSSQLNVDVYIQPNHSIENIELNFTIG